MDTRSQAPLAAREIRITLGSFDATAGTGEDGVARTVATLDQEPGPYVVRASYAGNAYYEPASDEADFMLAWEYTFVDDLGRGTVYLNPSSDEFRFAGSEGQSSILGDGVHQGG